MSDFKKKLKKLNVAEVKAGEWTPWDNYSPNDSVPVQFGRCSCFTQCSRSNCFRNCFFCVFNCFFNCFGRCSCFGRCGGRCF